MHVFSILTVVLCLLPTLAAARVIKVGQQESIKTIAEAAKLARDDDIVEIESGDYVGDVTVWRQKRLTIRGIGQRPVLRAAGRSAQGKAIWVIRNGEFNISNIEFRDATVADGNGAGIRFERGKLKVERCAFFANQTGILTANFQDAELIIEDSIFGQAQKQKKLPHLLYVGRIERLTVVRSRFHGGHYGHLLKSRARFNDIRYNFLVDGPGGRASYEAEFPNGGDVTLVGNVIGQSSLTENLTVVAYGAEGYVWPRNRLRMVHNTLYSEGYFPAWFLRVFGNNKGLPPEVMTRNNLLVGTGIFTMTIKGQHDGNHFAREAVFTAPSIMDFTLRTSSDLRGTVTPISPDPDGLQPRFEQIRPDHVSAIGQISAWAPGALQSAK